MSRAQFYFLPCSPFSGGMDVGRSHRHGLLEMIIFPFMLLHSFCYECYAKRHFKFFLTRALHEPGDKIHMDA